MRTTLALLFSASLALAAPTTSPVCAVCPITVNSTAVATGTSTASKTTYWLVNKSNSGPETPTYCGCVHAVCCDAKADDVCACRYNTDETHTWPQVMCYFAVSAVVCSGQISAHGMLADWKVLFGAGRVYWLPSQGGNSGVLSA
jgi:hypothetical protein